jgi:hypothetical protein
MSRSQIHRIKLFILRHAWLNLWDKHMTTGRINQVTLLSVVMVSKANHQTYVNDSPLFISTHTHRQVFPLVGAWIIDKVKKIGSSFVYHYWRTLIKPPDSLALSIFHYTADVKASSLTDREPRFSTPTRFLYRKRALQRKCLMQAMKFNVRLKVSRAASNLTDLQTVLVLMSTYRVNIQTSTIFGGTSIMYTPPLGLWTPEIVWVFCFGRDVHYNLPIPYLWISSLFCLLGCDTSQQMCIRVKLK